MLTWEAELAPFETWEVSEAAHWLKRGWFFGGKVTRAVVRGVLSGQWPCLVSLGCGFSKRPMHGIADKQSAFLSQPRERPTLGEGRLAWTRSPRFSNLPSCMLQLQLQMQVASAQQRDDRDRAHDHD
jgi:hypothetical protein